MEMHEVRTALNTTLPGNPRYQPKQLVPYFGYDYTYRGVGEVEIATIQVLGDIEVIPKGEIELLTADLIEAVLRITATEVDHIERTITKHDMRAWVRAAQAVVQNRLGQWFHIPLTSYDPLTTGRALQFLRAYREVIRKSLKEVITLFAKMTHDFAGDIQIGRTHGRHALPITVGFWLATILDRIIFNYEKIEQHSRELVGKISGAVGANNAVFGLKIAEKCGTKSFENRVLEKLGLPAPRISTQIAPPESLAYFLFSHCMLSASFAQFGDDARNLMRSEIDELAEGFDATQVASSTMAHKRNPWNLEELVGQWIRTKNEFGKVMDTLNSGHQRDLIASCVYRDFPIIMVNVQVQMNKMLERGDKDVPFLSRLTIDRQICRRNFDHSAHLILAEPIYIALQMAGYPKDAHLLVAKKLMPVAEKRHILLVEALEEFAAQDPEVATALSDIPPAIIELFHHPAS